jgi:hypothetical protein
MIDILKDLPTITIKYFQRQVTTDGSALPSFISIPVYLFTETGKNEFGILAVQERLYVNQGDCPNLLNGDYFQIGSQDYEANAVILNNNLPEIKPFFRVEIAKKLN